MTKWMALLTAVWLSFTLTACSSENLLTVLVTETEPIETETVETEPVETEPVEILIAGGSCGDGMAWKLDDQGILTVSGTGEIGDYVQGSGNQPWKEYAAFITEVVVEEGITGIGDLAFQNCGGLKRAVIGKDVARIGIRAFQNCNGLTDVELPPDVKVETLAFHSTPVEWNQGAGKITRYSGSIYDFALSQIPITGDYREDIITVAFSQLGYHEGDSKEDYAGGNMNGTKNYTEYGRYFNSIGRAWCSEFASWCIRMAGVPEDMVASSRTANAARFTRNTSAACYTWEDTVYGGGSYTPRKGDLFLWAWNDNSYTMEDDLSHTSILWEIEESQNGITVRTIDGNREDRVKVCEFKINRNNGRLVGQKGRLCYIIAPDYEGNGG